MSMEINHPPPTTTSLGGSNAPAAPAKPADPAKKPAPAEVNETAPVDQQPAADADAAVTPPGAQPWAEVPAVLHGDLPAALALDIALAFVAPELAAGGKTPDDDEVVNPWSRPMGLSAGNNMLRFLYLDEEIGWVYKIPNDAWWTGRQTTALEDAGPAHEAAEQKKKLSGVTRRSKPVAPDAAEAPVTPVIPGPLSAEQAALLRERDLHRA